MKILGNKERSIVTHRQSCHFNARDGGVKLCNFGFTLKLTPLKISQPIIHILMRPFQGLWRTS